LIPLKEGIRGVKAEGIGGEIEGDFMDNFTVSHPVSIHVMTHEAKVLIRSSSTIKHNCQVSSAKCCMTGNVQAVQIKSDLLILVSVGCLLLLYSPSWAQCCHHQCSMRAQCCHHQCPMRGLVEGG